MKWFMAIAAVLTVPALAFGGATFTLTGTCGTNVDVSSIDIADLVAAGGLMSVGMGIQTTTAGVAGFDVALATSTDDVVTQTARTVHLSYWGASVADKTLFTTYNLLKATPVSQQNLGGTYSYVGGPYLNAWPGPTIDCMDVNLSVNTAAVQAYLDAGNPSYVITIGPPTPTQIGIGDEQQPNQQVYDSGAPLPQVLITPEPASLLLLVAALPFLRRRR